SAAVKASCSCCTSDSARCSCSAAVSLLTFSSRCVSRAFCSSLMVCFCRADPFFASYNCSFNSLISHDWANRSK
ncbi:hypothetical protein PFISCL1PPCAC_5018, partial [Pristionchus fissidentatus]